MKAADPLSAEQRFDQFYLECDIVLAPLKFSIPSRSICKRLKALVRASQSIVDIGCGHGGTLWMFNRLNSQAAYRGIDSSAVAIEKCRRLLCGRVRLETGDVMTTGLPDTFDLIYCNQVIEHIEDDFGFLKMLSHSLRPGGHLYLGTVLRTGPSWYFYRNAKGQRVLEPTHVREYGSVHVITGHLREAGFNLSAYEVNQMKFPLLDPLLKLVSRLCKAAWMMRLLNSSITMEIRWLTMVPIPGYKVLQIIAQKP